MTEIIILGNKTYENLDVNPLIDRFENNIRCNMGIPSGNNGTIKDTIVLCSHLYSNVIVRKKSPLNMMNDYKDTYLEEYIQNFTDNFKVNEYKIINGIDKITPYNNYLKNKKCPYRFVKQPRTGIAAICNHLISHSNDNIYVFGFSVDSEVRKSFYVRDEIFKNEEQNRTCHDKDSEIKILRWLHTKGLIDATFCLLLDEKNGILSESLVPTDKSIQILKDCKIL